MRILFAYFDFTAREDQPRELRSLGECALNFSTTHDYKVHKSIGKVSVYTLSRSEKPANEVLPDHFWGERIYNVTAIVGENGTGKSTILHSIIEAVVDGLELDVPFALVLQETTSNIKVSEALYLYCSKADDWIGEGDLKPQDIPPEGLLKTKSMLIDNTLSMSTIMLDERYGKNEPEYHPNNMPNVRSTPVNESQKQFYNKSLCASLRYGNDISRAGEDIVSIPNFSTDALYIDYKSTLIPIRNTLATHFRYESMQETRFLFDRYCQNILQKLREKGFPVNPPKYLFVSIPSTKAIAWSYFTNDDIIVPSEFELPQAFSMLIKDKLIGLILANALLNISIEYRGELGTSLWYSQSYKDDIALLAMPQNDPFSHARMAIEIAKIFIQHAQRRVGKMPASTDYEIERQRKALEHVCNCQSLITFFDENMETLMSIFKWLPSGNSVSDEKNQEENVNYKIDMNETLLDDNKLECMITFLEIYRRVSTPRYFLIFSSGMSSGEKNLLRMLTQFRYVIDGPAVYREDSTADNTQNYLHNIITDKKTKKYKEYRCDTFFLFMDEADLTYHPEWQRIFVAMLTFVLPNMFRNPYNKDGKDDNGCPDTSGCMDIQVILATHSPLMLGDFPKASVNYLKKNEKGNVEVVQSPRQSTFGENLYTILKDGFFMTDTMGAFAKQKINSAAKWCKSVRDLNEEEMKDMNTSDMEEVFNIHYKTAQLLPNGIIQSKLLAELKYCAEKLGIDIPDASQSSEVAALRKRIAELERKLQNRGQA